MDSRDKHFELFFRSMDADDDLGFVIRAQVFIDEALRTIIETRLENPDAIADWKRRLFPSRLELALATGWKADATLIEALTKLYNYRNNLAHRLGTVLTRSQANDLYGCLPVDERARVDQQIIQAAETWQTKIRFSISSLVARMLQEAQRAKSPRGGDGTDIWS